MKYTLFKRKRGDRFWTQVGQLILPRQSAIRFYQTALINGAFDTQNEWALRPVKK